jgi:hypothetical protein
VGRTGLNRLFSIQPPQEAGFIFAKKMQKNKEKEGRK